jgi:dTDP-4-amino-4,6-dideoxygalactose transaminase
MSYLPFAKPTIDEETIAGVAEVLRSGWITSGPKVQEFEQALSAYLGGRIVRTFTSATGALEVALQACGIGPGHEVIVPAMTFAASANVVMRVGAQPVFVDVELVTRNLDPAKLEAAITPRTRAIMPVHFAGLAVDMDRVYDVAKQHKLRVIEDAAHAIGTRWKDKRIGSFGDLVSFSFHPNKNMTTIEGGALSLPSDAAGCASASASLPSSQRVIPRLAIKPAVSGCSSVSRLRVALSILMASRRPTRIWAGSNVVSVPGRALAAQPATRCLSWATGRRYRQDIRVPGLSTQF